MELNAVIDRIWAVREEKRQLAAQEKLLNQEYAELKSHLISNLTASNINSISNARARVTLTKNTVAKLDPEGWDDFVAYVIENQAYHLLYKAVASAACKEHLTVSSEEIPAVQLISITDISITTIKKAD
jgi:hypothetical protein